MWLSQWIFFLWSTVLLTSGQQFFGSSQSQFPNLIRPAFPSLPGQRNNPTYLLVASQVVRPGSVYSVVVNMLEPSATTNIVASVSRDGVEIAAAEAVLNGVDSETLLLRIPQTSVQGRYKLRVVGASNDILGPQFIEVSDLKFSPRFLTIVVYTSRAVYNADMKMLVRVIILNMELKPFNEPVTINILDPKGNIMASYRSVQLNVGVAKVTYTIPQFPPLGWWKIQVITYSQVETYDVLVEKYYNPKYEIDVIVPEFVISTDETYSGEIGAAYLAEGQIVGNITRRLLVTKPNARDKPILIDEEIVPYFAGGHEFEYNMEDIKQKVSLEAGTMLKVEGVVQEQFFGIAYPCFSTSIIIDSKVIVNFLGPSPKVFKPGMPFRVYVAASYDDMEPLPEEKKAHAYLEVTPIITLGGGQMQSINSIREPVPETGVLKVDFDVPMNAKFIVLKARYSDEDGDTAEAEIAAVLNTPNDNRAIHVYSTDSMANIGEYIVVHIQANFFMKKFWYMVISKGIIIHSAEEQVEPLRNPIKTISIPVASSMAPSFEVFVYHIARDRKIFADSVSIPINKFDRQKPNLRVNPYKDKTGNTVELGVIHIPGSYYGITSRDAATFCYKCGADLTKASVLENLFGFNEGTDRVTKVKWLHRGSDPDQVVYFDTPNAGLDASETFRMSSLIVLTDGDLEATDNCNISLGTLSCKDGRCYSSRKKCDGVRDCANGIDEIGCIRKKSTSLDMSLKEFRIYRKSRTEQFFDEEGEWGWIDFNTDYDDFFNREVSVRPSEWYVTGFAMNLLLGLSIQDQPIVYNGVRPFFMTIEVPERCKSGEQVGIRTDIFNNQGFGMFATVVIKGSEDYKFIHVEEAGFVASYNPKTSFGEHQHQVWIEANDQVVVYMPIVFTRLGDIDVTVEVWTTIGKGEDTATITVVPDGTKQRFHTSMLLDMRTHPQLIKYLDINVTETPVIAYQKWRRYVFGSPQARFSAVGDVFGPVYQPEEINTDVLLDKPYYNAEGLAFTFGATVWMLHYLRLTNQLTKEILYPSFEHMRYYYGSLLNFRKNDGSFFMWDTWGTNLDRAESSVWLTAYIVRVFQYAVFSDWENAFYIDPQVISSAVLWLIKQQTFAGAFVETSRLPLNTRMQTTARNLNPRTENIPLTAFVLIAIGEIDDLPGQLRIKASSAKSLATKFLENNYPSITDPYEMAITAYALTFVNSVEQDAVFQKLNEMRRKGEGKFYWGRHERPLGDIYTDNQRDLRLPRLPFTDDAVSVEATAYALLVYIANDNLWQENIVDWLNTMRGTEGGFISTQDSLVAMQALTEFTFRARLRDITDMRIDMRSSSSTNISETLQLNAQNLATLQSVEIPNVWGHLEIYSKGAGLAIAQLDYSYSVDRPELMVPPPQRSFDLELFTKYYGKNNSHIDITACQRWKLTSVSPQSGVAVFEIDVPTGYYQDIPKFYEYVNSNRVRNLRRMSVTDKKVYAYFDYLDSNYTCIKFTIQRWFPVANLSQYNLAKIYEYHAPERYNETIFHAYNVYVMDICQVCGSYQCPYCPYYSDSPMLFANLSLIITCIVSVLLNTGEIAGWTWYLFSRSAKTFTAFNGRRIHIITASVIILAASLIARAKIYSS
uniref:Macroglobulin complement-related 1 n=1 Tax=Epanerchodus sp. RS-2014 TaxID=1569310 RepID=A0A0E4FKL9_9MYRI|nr:macroglobulin complement-related 1 [Epanerchodus sp. RS-2014]